MRKLITVVALCTSAMAAADPSAIGIAVDQANLLLDTRVRHEAVHQSLVPEEADANTVRLRAGVETGKAWNSALIAEAEFIWRFDGEYRSDNAITRHMQYPVVPDPDSQEINRLQLVNTSVRDTVLTIGRQRILLDDQRFVGNVGWRQNEQTFDAVRVVNRPVPSLTVDVTYLNQVNRVFGPDSPQGRYDGDGYLGNVGYELPSGKLTAFGYALDFEPMANLPTPLDPTRISTQTYGARFTGERPIGAAKVGYALTHARQRDYGSNPLELDLDYSLLELSGTWRAITAGLGWEVLEGNGQVGFSAPLGTLHRFQGWADKFVATPGNGIDDRYVNLGAQLSNVLGADAVSAIAVYHDFKSERAAIDLGSEIDLQVQARWRRLVGTIRYADYARAGTTPLAYEDTRKFWVMLEHTL